MNKEKKTEAEAMRAVSSTLQYKMKGMMDEAKKKKQQKDMSQMSLYRQRQMKQYERKNFSKEQIYKLESDVRTMYDKHIESQMLSD